jgi:Uma2 family endonuclease
MLGEIPMIAETSRVLVEIDYDKAAREYMRRLPPEHFMEATPQATQRKITLESLDLVHAERPDVHIFNELLVQYPLPRRRKPGQVVPDNMVVIYPGTLEVEGSYIVQLQPARPFWMIEYISKTNPRKDYVDNVIKYERDLKVPYYLWFIADSQEMTLFKHSEGRFASVTANEHGRLEVPELELEIGLVGEWMRYWFRGELLPLPAELQSELGKERQARLAAEEENARLRAEIEKLKKGS